MAEPAPKSNPTPDDNEARNQASVDAAHGTTGWNAYDVWRKHVFTPGTQPEGKVREKS